MINAIRKYVNKLNGAINSLSIIAMVICVSSATLNTAMRYLLNHPLRWSEEVCVISLVWVVYCSLPLLEEHREHLNMTAIYNLFPEKFKSFVDLICKLTIVIIALYIAKISLDIMLRNYDLKINTQVLDLPYWTIYLVILISFVLIAMTSILALFPETKLENEGNSTIEEQGADTK